MSKKKDIHNFDTLNAKFKVTMRFYNRIDALRFFKEKYKNVKVQKI